MRVANIIGNNYGTFIGVLKIDDSNLMEIRLNNNIEVLIDVPGRLLPQYKKGQRVFNHFECYSMFSKLIPPPNRDRIEEFLEYIGIGKYDLVEIVKRAEFGTPHNFRLEWEEQ